MIAIIIDIIMILLGAICLGIGNREYNLELEIIGFILTATGIFFLFTFLNVNVETIQNWFKI